MECLMQFYAVGQQLDAQQRNRNLWENFIEERKKNVFQLRNKMKSIRFTSNLDRSRS